MTEYLTQAFVVLFLVVNPMGHAPVFGALAALLAAGGILGLLGQTGINVVTRLLGLLLAALAVQYLVDGIRGLFGV